MIAVVQLESLKNWPWPWPNKFTSVLWDLELGMLLLSFNETVNIVQTPASIAVSDVEKLSETAAPATLVESPGIPGAEATDFDSFKQPFRKNKKGKNNKNFILSLIGLRS